MLATPVSEDPKQDGDWIEKVVDVAGKLGFNKMRLRWKLIRWQENRRKAARRREQQVQHITYAHKTCPECGKKKLRRLIGAGGAIVFKGSGFYKTDYRSDSYRKGAEADKGSSGGGDGGKKPDAGPKKSGSGEG